ncbi:MAG: hypothetical protein EP332_03495 [Bacteroidetes bacterium]|nr:MAG: hypothetical protein EP332_03495 [Bacteroidota bacterium]
MSLNSSRGICRFELNFTKHITRIWLSGILLFLLASCSELESDKVKHEFAVSIQEEHAIENFDSVKFEPLDELNLGFFRGSVWIKLELQNAEDQDQSFVFVSHDQFNRNYNFYKLNASDGELEPVNAKAADLLQDQRTFNNPNPNLKIDLEPLEKATYLIASTSDGRTKDITPKLLSIESYFSYINEYMVWNIIYYALVVCLLAFNVFQWIVYKQQIYFFYVLYIVSSILVFLGIEGYFYTLPIRQDILDHFIFFTLKLWAFSLIIFTSTFLKINTQSPTYFRFTKLVLALVLGATLIYQFSFYHSSIQYLHYFENVLTPLWLLLIIGMIILSARAKRAELKYYLIPLSGFILLTIIGLFNVHFQVLPGNSFSYVKLGALVELFGFTYIMSLSVRKKLYKTEHLEKELDENRTKLKERDSILASTTRLTGVLNLIENSFSNEADWTDFKTKFQSLNPNFIDTLLDKHADLSKSEIRLLILIKTGHSQKEIARILNIEPASVKKSRNRIRKKLNVDQDINLDAYLINYMA